MLIVSEVIKDSDYILIHLETSDDALAEHFREQFNRPTAKGDLPVMPVTEQIQVDSSPLSEMEVGIGMCFLKRHKAAVPDALSPSSFGDNGELITL